jgi:hypothetical protein
MLSSENQAESNLHFRLYGRKGNDERGMMNDEEKQESGARRIHGMIAYRNCPSSSAALAAQ